LKLRLVGVVSLLFITACEAAGPRTVDDVYTIIRSLGGASTIRHAIAMEFFFDEGGRLLRHEVRELPAGR
jgi:hypothetical protein